MTKRVWPNGIPALDLSESSIGDLFRISGVKVVNSKRAEGADFATTDANPLGYTCCLSSHEIEIEDGATFEIIWVYRQKDMDI